MEDEQLQILSLPELCSFTPEKIVAKLRQIEVLVSQSQTEPLACKEVEIVPQTNHRWRKYPADDARSPSEYCENRVLKLVQAG